MTEQEVAAVCRAYIAWHQSMHANAERWQNNVAGIQPGKWEFTSEDREWARAYSEDHPAASVAQVCAAYLNKIQWCAQYINGVNILEIKDDDPLIQDFTKDYARRFMH